MFQRLYLILCICIFSSPVSWAQDAQSTGRRHLDTLTQPLFWGRGYTNDGVNKAAEYIRQMYIDYGGQSINGDYFQHFNISQVNTFPENIILEINGQKLKTGFDFIINGNSSSKSFNDIQFSQKDSITFINSEHNTIIELVDKLTFVPGINSLSNTTIKILKSSIKQRPQRVTLDLKSKLLTNYPTQNVITYIPGTKYKDSFLVFTAHYDHVGGLGNEAYFPGANDNASGVAMLLTLLDYYSKNPLSYSVAFIAFSGEELGLLGSKYFVENPTFPLTHIKFLMNLDLVANGDDGFTLVNGTEFVEQFNLITQINDDNKYFNKVVARTPAPNSDHYPFYVKGVPCFFLYTQGGSSAYHDVHDTSDQLELNHFNKLYQLLIDFYNQLR